MKTERRYKNVVSERNKTVEKYVNYFIKNCIQGLKFYFDSPARRETNIGLSCSISLTTASERLSLAQSSLYVDSPTIQSWEINDNLLLRFAYLNSIDAYKRRVFGVALPVRMPMIVHVSMKMPMMIQARGRSISRPGIGMARVQ